MSIDEFKSFIDYDGRLVPIEFSRIPFVPQRLFCVTDVPKDYVRGKHSHRKGKQYLFCLKGRIQVILDYGWCQKAKTLVPNQGLFIPEMVWDSQKFLTGQDVLLVLASMPYDKEDYIEDYDEFLKLSKKV